MEIVYYFLFGFLVSAIGVVPPGLLNMTAAKISMKESRKNAFLFSLGVIIVVAVQTFIALVFASYLDNHPEVIEVLQQVGLGVFICISVYFLFFAKDSRLVSSEEVQRSKRSRFFLGLFLSSINLFPLPYWVYMGITFSSFGWFKISSGFIALCVLGSALGTLAMLVLYAHYFNLVKKRRKKISLNVNYLIGMITAIISLITLIKILKDRF